MPTGYTAPVGDGKMTTLEDFAWSCARGMGFLIVMRDDPHDAPIPERFEPDTKYHDERLAEAEMALQELRGLTDDQCSERMERERADKTNQREGYNAKKRLILARYEAMRSKVLAWSVPNELSGMKDFMLNQLAESIRFDGGESTYPETPPVLSGSEWRNKKIEEYAKQIAYHTAERTKEIERTAERNRYLRLLRESLA